MRIKVKLAAGLYERVLTDLRRPHKTAAERVGFLGSTIGNRGGEGLLVFLTEYVPIPDEYYIEDPSVGARINSAAILMAMQRVLDTGQGIFHVHLHDCLGVPRYSWTDRQEIPPIIESCRNVGMTVAHGILLLSSNKANCMVWPPSGDGFVNADRVSVVGHPLRFLEK